MLRSILAIFLSSTLLAAPAHATLIERSFDLDLGEIVDNPNRDGVLLTGVGFFFRDDPIFASVGDTIVIDMWFTRSERIQIIDFGDPATELVSIGLGIESGDPLIAATWLGSLTLLDPHGYVGPYSQPLSFNGGGGGIGYGAAVNLTNSQVNFGGVRLGFDILTGANGFPATFSNITGLQIEADLIRVVPVPEPATWSLIGAGLLAMFVGRRRIVHA